eukprot:1748-Pelagococcus_subviridis.AAC.3
MLASRVSFSAAAAVAAASAAASFSASAAAAAAFSVDNASSASVTALSSAAVSSAVIASLCSLTSASLPSASVTLASHSARVSVALASAAAAAAAASAAASSFAVFTSSAAFRSISSFSFAIFSSNALTSSRQPSSALSARSLASLTSTSIFSCCSARESARPLHSACSSFALSSSARVSLRSSSFFSRSVFSVFVSASASSCNVLISALGGELRNLVRLRRDRVLGVDLRVLRAVHRGVQLLFQARRVRGDGRERTLELVPSSDRRGERLVQPLLRLLRARLLSVELLRDALELGLRGRELRGQLRLCLAAALLDVLRLRFEELELTREFVHLRGFPSQLFVKLRSRAVRVGALGRDLVNLRAYLILQRLSLRGVRRLAVLAVALQRVRLALRARRGLAHRGEVGAHFPQTLLRSLVPRPQALDLIVLRLEVVVVPASVPVRLVPHAPELALGFLARGFQLALHGHRLRSRGAELPFHRVELSLVRLRGRVRALHLQLDSLHALISVALRAHEVLHEVLFAHERLLEALLQHVDRASGFLLDRFQVEALHVLRSEVQAALEGVHEVWILEVGAVQRLHGPGAVAVGGTERIGAAESEERVAAGCALANGRLNGGAPERAPSQGPAEAHHGDALADVPASRRRARREVHRRHGGTSLRDGCAARGGDVGVVGVKERHRRRISSARDGRRGVRAVHRRARFLDRRELVDVRHPRHHALTHHALALDDVQARAERVEIRNARAAGPVPRGGRAEAVARETGRDARVARRVPAPAAARSVRDVPRVDVLAQRAAAAAAAGRRRRRRPPGARARGRRGERPAERDVRLRRLRVRVPRGRAVLLIDVRRVKRVHGYDDVDAWRGR